MKKILAMTLALAMSLSLAACGGGGGGASSKNDASSGVSSSTPQGGGSSAQQPAGGDVAYTTVEPGKLIMSTNCHFPPYEMIADGEGPYVGADGVSYEGIDVEIAVALADALGLELVIDDMEFTSALLAVQENRADMILGALTYRTDRDEVMDFSTTYSKGVQVVIVTEDSDIQELDDLANDKMIGCQEGTTGYDYASASEEDGGYGEEHVNAYANGALAVEALKNGQIDAVIIDNGPAQAYVAANTGLRILPAAWVEEDYCLAVDEGNSALLNVLNAELEKLIDDGTIQTIVDKYIKAD